MKDVIVAVDAAPLDLELKEAFGIAGGVQARAHNVLVTVRLDDGTTGIGEAAPFPAFNHETQEDVLRDFTRLGPQLVGHGVRQWRLLSAIIADGTHCGSLRCALETAVLDALCRQAGLPLWAFFGGAAESALRTDLTITAGDVEHARAAAIRAAAAGFESLKVKVGAAGVDEDIRRLLAIHDAAPDCALIVDANAGYTADEACALVDGYEGPWSLFEQPVASDDLDGLARVRERAHEHGISIAADESASHLRDLPRLQGLVDVVNIKATKCGLVEAYDMAVTARALGLQLMIGGMVETRLAMSASACLAAGLGVVSYIDLDTPLFFTADPFKGGMRYEGSAIHLDHIAAGHGVTT